MLAIYEEVWNWEGKERRHAPKPKDKANCVGPPIILPIKKGPDLGITIAGQTPCG